MFETAHHTAKLRHLPGLGEGIEDKKDDEHHQSKWQRLKFTRKRAILRPGDGGKSDG